MTYALDLYALQRRYARFKPGFFEERSVCSVTSLGWLGLWFIPDKMHRCTLIEVSVF